MTVVDSVSFVAGTVSCDTGRRLWLLTTPHTSYAFRLREDDSPAHVHWGIRLTLDEAAAVPSYERPPSSFAEVTDDEYPAEGGARYGPPALRLRFPDGSRGIEWRYLDHTIDGGELTVRFCDRHYPVEISLHYRVRPDTDVLERWVTLTHTAVDGAAIELSRVDSAQWTLPPRPGYRLSHTVGDWSAETHLVREQLPVAETVLVSRRGTTGHPANPWVMVDSGDAGEEHGEVFSAALAFSGSWRIVLRRTPDGRLTWTGGAGGDGLSWHLPAGGSWQTPVFAGVHTASGGFGTISRAWHDFLRRYVQPTPTRLQPVIYNSWEATGFAVDPAGQMHLADLAAGLGVETFVMDDGWFLGRFDDTAGLGDWTPDPRRFPDGLGPLIAHVRALGMSFGLWVEPEMVSPASNLYHAHPDWVLHLPHRHRTERRHQLVLNFARPDVVEWAWSWLSALVAENGLDYLKWDMNRPFTEAGWPSDDDPDRLWFAHVAGVYEVLDRLRARFPDLRIEGCSGGGGRVDLGMLHRVDTMWTSDNTDAVDRIAIQDGYTQVYPAGTMSCWVTDSPNPLTRREVPLEFRFHIAMTGVLGLGGDLRTWSPSEMAAAATLVGLYKDIRPVVQRGVRFRLPSGVQYVTGDRVIVIGWSLPGHYGPQPSAVRLTGLDPEVRYRDDDTGAVHSGALLCAHGLPWAVNSDREVDSTAESFGTEPHQHPLPHPPSDEPVSERAPAGHPLPAGIILPSGGFSSRLIRLTRIE